MKAIILAAGRGSRLEQLTANTPKGLVRLHGQTLIERMVRVLSINGVDKIGIVTGYKREAFEFLNLHEFHNPSWHETNMVRSLFCAKSWLEESDVLICYSDIFVEPEIIRSMVNAPNENLQVAYDPDWAELWAARSANILDDAESWKMEGNQLVEIGNRCNSISEIEGQYMGLIKMTPASWVGAETVFKNLQPSLKSKISMTELIQSMIMDGQKVYGVRCQGQWGEVDTVSDLELYEKYAREKRYGDWFYDFKV